MKEIAVLLIVSLWFNAAAYAQKPREDPARSSGIVNGMARTLPYPVYPPAAGKTCAGGPVEVEVLIGSDGKVLSAAAVRGDELLREAAVNAARKAEFPPRNMARLRGLLVYNFDPIRSCEKTLEIPLGQITGWAKVLPLPKLAGEVGPRAQADCIVRVVIDLPTGKVLEAKALAGDLLVRKSAETAAREAVFEPTLPEFAPVRGIGFITYSARDLNGETRINENARPFTIIQAGVINERARSIPQPQPARSERGFIAGSVEVAILVSAYDGKVLAARAVSGPAELRERSESAAMKVIFSPSPSSGGNPAYVVGTILYNFENNGKVR